MLKGIHPIRPGLLFAGVVSTSVLVYLLENPPEQGYGAPSGFVELACEGTTQDGKDYRVGIFIRRQSNGRPVYYIHSKLQGNNWKLANDYKIGQGARDFANEVCENFGGPIQ